jgi:hypothetical protein
MRRIAAFLRGAGVGAGIMFFWDPDRGRRRRSLVRDQLIHGICQTRKTADLVRRDAGNRLSGVAAEVRGALRREVTTDDILLARVRARLGRCVSHPAAIHVTAEAGRVTLSGPVLASEVKHLINFVRHTRGVRQVINHLSVQRATGNDVAIKAKPEMDGQPVNMMASWPPSTRAALGLTALGLTALGVGRGSIMRPLLQASGIGLMGSVLLEQQGKTCQQAIQTSEARAEPQRRAQPRESAAGSAGGSSQQGHTHQVERTNEPAIEQASSPMQAGEPVIHDL